MSKTAECSPDRGVFEVGRLGHCFFDFVYLLLLLLFDVLVSKDLIFRHEKETSGREGISTKCVKVGRASIAFDKHIVKDIA